ncbi:MAG: hypothetical protein KF729_34020 [Sandaracinaceae bacterium]|nr:hypothetical protein [Sandaracinaceae bacterium]
MAARSLAIALAIALAGCGSRALPMRPSARSFTPDDYPRLYGDWTRGSNEFAFDRLEDVLHVTATFESWEFRWAYVVRYAADYSLATHDRTRLLRSTLADAQERHRFFVTMVGNRYRESDLTDPGSAWRVLLVDPAGRQTRPVEVTRLRRPGAAERVYFPSVSVQRHTFRVAFPTQHEDGTPVIAPDAREVVLRFTGAEGTVDLRWELDPSAPGEAPAFAGAD